MKMTIKDIASRAQVSTATVSNVLTKKKYVSPELSQRVLDVIKETNYSPNTYARSLKINKSYRIGVHVPDITNPFFSEIVKYIHEAANRGGYQIELCISNDDAGEEKRLLDSFLVNGVDGVINIAPKMREEALNEYEGMPMVIVDRPAFPANDSMAFVYADNFLGAEAVASYFVKKKYRKFLCFMGSIDEIPNARKRLDGFIFGLQRGGYKKEDCRIYFGDFSFDSGYAIMEQFLATDWNRDERYAAFVGSDIMAWGAMEALKTHKLKVPRDMGIVGYDNIYFSNFIFPKLTTVENPTKELGIHAIHLILEAIEGNKQLAGISKVLQASLVIRSSC